MGSWSLSGWRRLGPGEEHKTATVHREAFAQWFYLQNYQIHSRGQLWWEPRLWDCLPACLQLSALLYQGLYLFPSLDLVTCCSPQEVRGKEEERGS